MHKTCLTCYYAKWETDISGICEFPEITFPNCWIDEEGYFPYSYRISPATKPDCLYWKE